MPRALPRKAEGRSIRRGPVFFSPSPLPAPRSKGRLPFGRPAGAPAPSRHPAPRSSGLTGGADSQAPLRHMGMGRGRCFLPDLTGLATLPLRKTRLSAPPVNTDHEVMAEREGFEPSVHANAHTISSRAPSASRASLQQQASKESPPAGDGAGMLPSPAAPLEGIS